MTDGRYGHCPDEFLDIEAAKEAGISWYEMQEKPIRDRHLLLSKVATERKVVKAKEERAQRERTERRKR